jgi:hypothetical protein
VPGSPSSQGRFVGLKTKNTKQNQERIPSKPSQQAESGKRWLTFNLLLLQLEDHACSLCRLLQAKDRGLLFLDGLTLIREGDTQLGQLPI